MSCILCSNSATLPVAVILASNSWIVLTINGTENHTERMIYSEKNRDGGKLKMMFEFDKKLMTFKNKNTPTVGDYS